MNTSQIYIAIAIAALAIIAIVLFVVRKNKPREKLSTLGAFALLLVIAGIVFGDSQPIGYGLMTVGGILAAIDIVRKLRKHE
ncbi:MAG: hypothetical protein PHC85_01950 [Candidatus Pacebacteria bacterium]|nr:hypothetical protein [Candidatus Paceibacterota bacterium]